MAVAFYSLATLLFAALGWAIARPFRSARPLIRSAAVTLAAGFPMLTPATLGIGGLLGSLLAGILLSALALLVVLLAFSFWLPRTGPIPSRLATATVVMTAALPALAMTAWGLALAFYPRPNTDDLKGAAFILVFAPFMVPAALAARWAAGLWPRRQRPRA